MKETKYNNKEINIKVTIISLIILILILLVCGFIFYRTLMTSTEDISDKILVLLVTGFFIIFITIGLLSSIIGIFKAKMSILNNKHNIQKHNPYIYYRELPNEYGIGIATILMDSTIENEKDIVAVILDLCAKGYLDLKKKDNIYELGVLKGIDDKLLSNERYILSLIIKNDIKNINYNEWFNYCMQDGINLDLFRKKEQSENDVSDVEKRTIKIKKITKIYRNIVLIISVLITISIFFTNIEKYTLPFAVISIVLQFLLWVVMSFIILFIPVYLIPTMIVSFFSVGKEAKTQAFNLEILNYIEPTKKGEKEIQKLNAFKAFIKDFGMFADKNPEEIILWDYYLSYAQVFGLTKEILATGYEKIIKNGSFEIENIDLIRLNQINILNI